MIQTKIRQVIEANGFVAQNYLQGLPEYNYLKLPDSSRRMFRKKESVLIEGLYQGKPSVLKMIVAFNNNRLLFRRELYAYTTLAAKEKLIKTLIPAYYHHAFEPFPYLIIEKVAGQKIGDWYNVQKQDFALIEKSVTTIRRLHETVHIPDYMAYPLINRSPKFLYSKILSQLKVTNYQSKSRMADYLKIKLTSAEREWISSRKGFSYGDFSLSNIIENHGSIRFIDWENIGNSALVFDFAVLIFAIIGSKIEKVTVNYCRKVAKQNQQLNLLNYLIIYQIIKNMSKFYRRDEEKYHQLSLFLDRQLVDDK